MKSFENYHLKLLDQGNAGRLNQLVIKNQNNLIRYFPITIENSNEMEKAEIYVSGFQQKIESREMFPFGIFQEENLIGMMYVKSIDWRVLKCELGYFIDKNFQGKGITTEMISRTINYCFGELGLNKIFLRISPENIGSIRVAEKCGFKKEGVLRKEFRIETGELIDVVYFGLLKNDSGETK